MVQPRVRRSTATMPRKNARPEEVVAALPRQRASAPARPAVPAPRPEPDPLPEADLPKAPDPASEQARGALQRLWRIVTGLLLIATAVASLTAMVTVMTQHLGFAPVLSPSMEPTFHPGDLVITKPEPVSAIKIGQVVALPVPSAPSQRYVHRIISVTMKDGRPLVRTKGDANPTPEPFTLRINSPTVPLVVAKVPYLGRLSVLLQHSVLRLTVTAITLAAILLSAWRLLVGSRTGARKPGNGAGRHRH